MHSWQFGRVESDDVYIFQTSTQYLWFLLMLLKFSTFRTLVKQANYSGEAERGRVETAWAYVDHV